MANRDGFRGENDRAGAVSPYVNQRGIQHNGGEGVAGPVEPRLFIDDPDFTLYVGDVRDVLAGLPDESVHCVVTSPPYWGLRDYGTGLWDGGDPDCDHLRPELGGDGSSSGLNAKYQADGRFADDSHSQRRRQLYTDVCGKCGARRVDRQLGLEATPDLYVENMVAVFREVRRVLRRDGTCWLNLGDSYAGNGGGGGTTSATLAKSDARRDAERRTQLLGGLKPKDLVGIPWRVAFALQADGWYLRADVIWSKPNPMPESVSDRPTKAHEYLFLLTRSPRYFYDADAIREQTDDLATKPRAFRNGDAKVTLRQDEGRMYEPRAHRNRRSVWEIATEAYPDAHFATFPQALVEPCVKAGTSERGCCPVCGAPWEREVERGAAIPLTSSDAGRKSTWTIGDAARDPAARTDTPLPRHYRPVMSEEWRPTCEHDAGDGDEENRRNGGDDDRLTAARNGSPGPTTVPCVVLDPFMGSGTTALVARRLGRRSIGVELNETYARLAARRLAQLSLLA